MGWEIINMRSKFSSINIQVLCKIVLYIVDFGSISYGFSQKQSKHALKGITSQLR